MNDQKLFKQDVMREINYLKSRMNQHLSTKPRKQSGSPRRNKSGGSVRKSGERERSNNSRSRSRSPTMPNKARIPKVSGE